MSFNHVRIEMAGKTSRVDYLLSALDATDGDPRVRAMVAALKGLTA